jgi:hypothetical protein
MARSDYMETRKLIDLLKRVDLDQDRFVLVRDGELVLGRNPFDPTKSIDFATEKMVALSSHDSLTEKPDTSPVISSRKTGDYWFEIEGCRVGVRSQKELLGEALRALEKAHPGTLEKLSRIRGRSKAIVSRDPNTLFNKPHLVAKFAQKLMDGWWFGTNNNANETNSRLQEAATCAGLKWGETFKTSLSVDAEALLRDLKLSEPA